MYVIKVTCKEDKRFYGYITEYGNKYGNDYFGATTDINFYRVKKYKNKSRAIKMCEMLKLKKYSSNYRFEIESLSLKEI